MNIRVDDLKGPEISHLLKEHLQSMYLYSPPVETGSADVFTPARGLYTRFGFKFCAPFAEYVEDPFCVFMSLEL